jgi:putative nucleotidyltransferase with HDIG domain
MSSPLAPVRTRPGAPLQRGCRTRALRVSPGRGQVATPGRGYAISARGLVLLSPDDLTVGDRVWVEVDLPDGRRAGGHAIVAQIAGDGGKVACFEDLSAEVRALLDASPRAHEAPPTDSVSSRPGDAAAGSRVLDAMLRGLALRDRMTARHSAAVARYARELAGAVGASAAQQRLAHTAGLLHDIGKFILPDSILQAGRGLTAQDWELVKRHPAASAEIVAQVSGYAVVARAILHHHERIDGRGYPHGLRGTEIPWMSRVISVADTYDAMTARDSYSPRRSVEGAVAELRRVAGTQLDARLVASFVELVKTSGVAFQHADDADFEAELAAEHSFSAG